MFFFKQTARKLEKLKSYYKQDAEKAFEQGRLFLEKNPKNHHAAFITAWGALETNKLDEAIQFINQALENKLDDYAYHRFRAKVYLEKNQPFISLQDFDAMDALKPNNEATWQSVSKICDKKNPEQTLNHAKLFLEKNPKSHFGAFIAAWGALETNKLDEAIQFINQAILIRPKNYHYHELRAKIHLAKNEPLVAIEDFCAMTDLKPEKTNVWKSILKIRDEHKLELSLPKNITVVSHDLSVAYHDRNWTRYNDLLNDLQSLSPVHAKYQTILKDEFFMRLKDPVKTWEDFCKTCNTQNETQLASTSFTHFFGWLIKYGDTDRVLSEFEKFKSVYQRTCPSLLAAGVAGLLARDKRHEECLTFLNNVESNMTSEAARKTFHLRTYHYRYACKRGESKNESDHVFDNPLSDDVFELLSTSYLPESTTADTEKLFNSCWKAIRQTSDRILLDLRFSSTQLDFLQKTILQSLQEQKPLSLLRMGDSDSYGFGELYKNFYPDWLCQNTENMWWGKSVSLEKRQSLIEGFMSALQNADMVGMPGPMRFANEFNVEPKDKSNTRGIYHYKYHTLLSGMKKLLEENFFSDNRIWLDQYCNFSFRDQSFFSDLLAAAKNIAVVTCFTIPENHFLRSGHDTQVIPIPPHTKVASQCPSSDKILPDVIEEIRKKVCQATGPGTLLIVSAGFAGKSLIEEGRQSGAVSIDFGSALDDLVGLKTRSAELHSF